jgi:hypothetical protein
MEWNFLFGGVAGLIFQDLSESPIHRAHSRPQQFFDGQPIAGNPGVIRWWLAGTIEGIRSPPSPAKHTKSHYGARYLNK